MASSSFRDSVNSLGWSRRDPDLPVHTNSSSSPFFSRIQSLNPFGQGEGYVQLPTHESPAPRREEEESAFACKSSTQHSVTDLLHRPVQVTETQFLHLVLFHAQSPSGAKSCREDERLG